MQNPSQLLRTISQQAEEHAKAKKDPFKKQHANTPQSQINDSVNAVMTPSLKEYIPQKNKKTGIIHNSLPEMTEQKPTNDTKGQNDAKDQREKENASFKQELLNRFEFELISVLSDMNIPETIKESPSFRKDLKILAEIFVENVQAAQQIQEDTNLDEILKENPALINKTLLQASQSQKLTRTTDGRAPILSVLVKLYDKIAR